MRTRRVAVAVVVGLLLMTGCRWPWEPKSGPIVGTVSCPDGAPVWGAMVGVEQGDTTFTGTDGRFWLPVPAGLDTVAVWARDGFTPGRAYAETRSGRTRAAVSRDVVIVRLDLSEVSPILALGTRAGPIPDHPALDVGSAVLSGADRSEIGRRAGIDLHVPGRESADARGSWRLVVCRHASIETTQRYARLSDEAVMREAARISG